MMLNGRPFSNENGYIDDGLITRHSQDEIDVVLSWISENISPRKTPLCEHTSYGIKHLLKRDTGIYLTNNEFKDAMLLAGYRPVNPDELNWHYRISRKSKAFTRKTW
jgi:hypothetical protein